MANLQLTSIEYNHEQVHKIVLTNVVKMLTNRGLLSKNKMDENIKKLTEAGSLNNIYKIKLDNPIVDDLMPEFDGKTLYMAMFDQDIKTINKSHPMINFLLQNKNNQKILIVKSINDKSKYNLKQDYPHTEVFEEGNLMTDMVELFNIPTHVPLSQEESEAVIREYATHKKQQLPRILDSEPMGCYFNLQPGQVVRILRPSGVTGFTVSYRITIKDTTLGKT